MDLRFIVGMFEINKKRVVLFFERDRRSDMNRRFIERHRFLLERERGREFSAEKMKSSFFCFVSNVVVSRALS